MSREEQKLSGAMRLFEALSGVDEELLAKADVAEEGAARKDKRKIRTFRGSKVRLAACLAAAASLFLVVGAVWSGAPMLNGKKSAETAVMTNGSWAGNTMADSAAEVTENLAEETFGADLEGAVEEEKAEDIGGNLTSDTTQSATESAKESTEAQKHTQNSESETDGIENKDTSKREEGAITECVGSIPPDDRVELSEEEAYAAEVLGAYIPSNIPKGYTWESARASVNAKTGDYESIFLCWTKGMDSIMITVSKADVENLVVTDIAHKEVYDVSLYDVPYAETVPEEYRVCFDNPIFMQKDISLDLVQSRMKVVADAGDTGTPRGNFSIIYPEGILLDFNGDGTAEEIWEMLR